MRWRVVLYLTDEGYTANVPDLPGCWSERATAAEAMENVRVAVREYLAARDDKIPADE